MQTHKHTIVRATPENMIEPLLETEKRGWELVTVMPQESSIYENGKLERMETEILMFFKKRIR